MNDDKLVRNILLLVGLAFLLLLVVLYTAYRNLPSILGRVVGMPDIPELKLPEEMKEARVVLGGDLLEKDTFYSDADLGAVSDIRPLFSPQSEPLLVMVGDRAAVFLAANRAPVRTVHFPRGRANRVVLADLEGDGNPEFLSRGSWAYNVVLFDTNGRELWSYTDEVGVNDAAAGDVDGDGVAEIVVGFNGDGGVHLLNATGNRLWRKSDGNVWQVAMVDVDGDGRCEIVHSSAGGDLTIRDARGDVALRRDDLNTYFSSFALTDWGPNRASGFLIGADDGELLIFSARGDRAARLPAPDAHGVAADSFGTTLIHPAGGVHYAALAAYNNWDRTALYIYDTSLNLVYYEVLEDSCTSIAANRSESGETLLVGCDNTVWEYSWKPAAAR